MSSVLGLKARPRSATRLPASAPMFLQLSDHPPLLQFVDLNHRVQQLEVIAAVTRKLPQCRYVLARNAFAAA
jgi:hypothetical protein